MTKIDQSCAEKDSSILHTDLANAHCRFNLRPAAAEISADRFYKAVQATSKMKGDL
jgi:hypothetical protein